VRTHLDRLRSAVGLFFGSQSGGGDELGGTSYDLWRARVATSESDMGAVEAELHEAAVVAARWHDFGDPTYREGLGRLLTAIELSDYTAAQRERIRRTLIVPALRSRLYSERGWRERPDCLNDPIDAPLMVCGLPRTGTTALHQLLSMDERAQGLNGWLVLCPMPRPPRDKWMTFPEYRAVATVQKAAMRAEGSVKAAHLRTADRVDEPLELMSQSFVTNTFPALFHLPGYDEWFRAQDQRPIYRRLADNLRLIGSNDRDKSWLLQNPGNILSLDALLDAFPDARIVWTHREPGRTLASLSSLLAGVRTTLLGEMVSTNDIAPREVSLWSHAVTRAMDIHDRHPDNFHDVDFDTFVADPLGTARGIYERFGLTLDKSSESVMRAWVRDNPIGKHGVHSYNREGFGLSDDLIKQRFGGYIERFGLTRKTAA